MENGDQIEEFILKCIIKDKENNKIRVSDVYKEYKTWCETEKYKVISDRTFNKIMNKEFKKEKCGGNMYFYGIRIKKETVKEIIPDVSSESEISIEEENVIPEPKIQKKQPEYIKFKDCCLHIPTFICIKETPKLNYLMTNKVDLETIKNKLLRVRYFETVKECCDFYVNLEEEIIKTKINDELKIASLIFLTGAVYSKYNKNRGLIICDTYEEFEKIK
jgi:hypothetical protein